MLRSFIAALAVLAAATAAQAGIVTAEQKLADQRALVEQYYGNLSIMRESADPLIDYATAAAPDAGCSAHPPRTYAVLVGVNTVLADPKLALRGAENDVDLIAAAFKARFGDSLDMVELKGDAATRDSLRATLLDVLGKVQCGDIVAFYFGGQATYFGFDNTIDLRQAARSIPKSDPDFDKAQLLLGIIGKRADFFLSGHEADIAHPFSAVDLNDFVTNVRNRKADIVVVLDAAHSGAAALLEQQRLVDPGTGWSNVPGAASQARLVPDREDFAAYYSSVDSRAGIEKTFVMPDGTSVVHGNFSFAFAEALQDSAAVTASGLADGCTMPPPPTRTTTARSRPKAPIPRCSCSSGSRRWSASPAPSTSPRPSRCAGRRRSSPRASRSPAP